MRRIALLFAGCVLATCALSAAALTTVDPAGLPSANDYSSTLLPEMSGVVSWKTLGQVEPVKRGDRMVAEFGKAILALDQQSVRILGFMMPLDAAQQQRHFLLSAVPASCPYCMPSGPEAIVEVVSKQPVKYGFEPVLMMGKLSVLKNDPSGLLYRITDAESVLAPGNSAASTF
jgi:uncharacterized protein